MASYDNEEYLCIKCGGTTSKGNLLNVVGAPNGKRKEECKKDPLERRIEQFERLKIEELTRILMNNKATQEPTYIHSLYRTNTSNKT